MHNKTYATVEGFEKRRDLPSRTFAHPHTHIRMDMLYKNLIQEIVSLRPERVNPFARVSMHVLRHCPK